MKAFTTLTTLTGKEIKVRSNSKKRAFTIKVDRAVYKTEPMNKEEFEECEHNTANDWQEYLKTNASYYES